MTGVSKNTVAKLLVDVGKVCADFQDRELRDLPCRDIQCDEIWSFVYVKDKNLPESMKGEAGVGSVWTWTAICADTKVVPACLVGLRDAEFAHAFIADLASRVRFRVQLTTDGHRPYLTAVEEGFGGDIDFAQLVKIYGSPREDEARYSPGTCIGCESTAIVGNPDPDHISTSYVERQNLTMRMAMRRFTRLTNAFSKKVVNLRAAVSLHYMHYNYVRVHRSLRMTPAMAVGVTDRLWEMGDIVDLLIDTEHPDSN